MGASLLPVLLVIPGLLASPIRLLGHFLQHFPVVAAKVVHRTLCRAAAVVVVGTALEVLGLQAPEALLERAEEGQAEVELPALGALWTQGPVEGEERMEHWERMAASK